MSVLNKYFTGNSTIGTSSEQNIIEDIIVESMRIYGVEIKYIPRTLISKDEILGEDRLSKFEHSFAIAAYFENIDNFGGGGYMAQKFGLMIEQSASLVIPIRSWNDLIGRSDTTILPNRPCEGDLIYFPLSKSLFEIKFVDHQSVFYQIGKLYVYKLQVELFQYASEKINTGDDAIDVFETLKSFDIDITTNTDTQQSYGDNDKFIDKATDVIFSETNPFGEL